MRQHAGIGQSVTLKDFKQLTLLGEGAYSTVFKVLRLSCQNIFSLKKVKLPSLSEKEKQNSLNEVRLLASVAHENVIAYKEAFLDEASGCLCIVTEFADGGDLYQKITQHQKLRTFFRESDVWHCLFGMVHGLKALHDMKILHRDMKCANVFLGLKGEVKLGDFNVSKVAKRGLCMTQTGTPYYASPEVWRDMPYDAKSDMWSLGCILYEMVALRPPFRADDMEALYRKVLKGQYPRIPSVYSRDVSEAISILLQVNPRSRPNIDQFLASPVMQRHVNYDNHGRNASKVNQQASDLLQTIKLPKNCMDAENLSICLPKPRYDVAADQQSGASNGDAAAGTEVQSQQGSRHPNHAPNSHRPQLDEGRLKDALDSLLYDNEKKRDNPHVGKSGSNDHNQKYDNEKKENLHQAPATNEAPPTGPRQILPSVHRDPRDGPAVNTSHNELQLNQRGSNLYSNSHQSGVNPISRGSSHVAHDLPPSSYGRDRGHDGRYVPSHTGSQHTTNQGGYQQPHDSRYAPNTGGRYDQPRYDMDRYYQGGQRQKSELDYRHSNNGNHANHGGSHGAHGPPGNHGNYDGQGGRPPQGYYENNNNNYYNNQQHHNHNNQQHNNHGNHPRQGCPPDRQVGGRRQLAVAGGAVARNKRPDQNRQYYRQQNGPGGNQQRRIPAVPAGNYRVGVPNDRVGLHNDRPIRAF